MNFIRNYFKLDEHKTDIRTEFFAGLATFLTMGYVIVVNPLVLSEAFDIQGMERSDIIQMLIIVTVLITGLITIFSALYSKRPFALAPGMGLNAFFVVVVTEMGVPFETALASLFVAGLIFIAITLMGVRKYIVQLFPLPVRLAVGTGIGLFLGLIGLENMQVIDSGRLNSVLIRDPVAVVALLGMTLTLILHVMKVRGAILVGIFSTAILGYLVSLTGFNSIHEVPLIAEVPEVSYNISPLAGVFINGFENIEIVSFSIVVFTFFFVDFFDTAGTLTGVGQAAGFLDKDGNLPEIEKPMLADAIGTTAGSTIGVSPITVYIESAAGIEQGGRTGLTALFTGIFFLLCLFIVPLAVMIPSYASSVALVVVALFMVKHVASIDWQDVSHAIPAAFVILVMPLTYNIAYGIIAGILSYIVVEVARGRMLSIHWGLWLMGWVSLLYVVLVTGGF